MFVIGGMMAEHITATDKKRAFTRADKIKYWRKWRASGISKSKFCVKNRLPSTFYSWGRLVARDDTSASGGPQGSAKELLGMPFLALQSTDSQHEGQKVEQAKCLYQINGINLELAMSVPAMAQFVLEIHNATTVIR